MQEIFKGNENIVDVDDVFFNYLDLFRQFKRISRKIRFKRNTRIK